jgi:hypothetical protein
MTGVNLSHQVRPRFGASGSVFLIKRRKVGKEEGVVGHLAVVGFGWNLGMSEF